MAAALLAPILALLLAVSSTALADRASIWPEWRLPAPLARPSNLPGQRDLTYPAWMEGRWQLHSDNFDVEVQFAADANGAVVGDRAGNAAAIGRALLGEALLEVADDPANPNRQIALLRGNQRLESTVVGRRSETPDRDHFWADELALQVLHGPGDPRVSRVETLSHYSRHSDGSVGAEQWQASYPSPALGLAAAIVSYPRPRASSSPGPLLSITRSNPMTRSRISSSVSTAEYVDVRRNACSRPLRSPTPWRRSGSPSAASTFTTLAPPSASNFAQYAPAMPLLRSSTATSSSG